MKYFPFTMEDSVDYLMSDNFKSTNENKLSEYITVIKTDRKFQIIAAKDITI